MTCDEFERVLPELEGEHTLEQEAHLRSCSACSDLLVDLNAISSGARLLESVGEPSPRVWETIEAALRKEGLIRETQIAPQIVHTLEDGAHLESCVTCSQVAQDLNEISQQARMLQATEEPSPRVWNSIEIVLKNEGLIRKPQSNRQPAATMSVRWRLAWLVPAAVAAMLILGTLMFEHGGGREQVASTNAPQVQLASAVADAPTEAEERELLRLVGERAPALKAAYEADLSMVNSYIRDAEQSAKANPQDEMAQQYLMSAYEQRAMIYEMAMNRSLR